MAKRNTVWVLWARTWNNQKVKLCRVTSKKAYQRHHNRMKAWLALQAGKKFSTSESMPLYMCESTDKEVLIKMMELARPLAVNT